MNLKPLFKNLVEVKKPNFKEEWIDTDFKNVNKALKKMFISQSLKDHHGTVKTMHSLKDIEYFFGLPYTSSSSYAMVGNTNTQYYIDIEENFNIELFAVTQDNKIIMEVWDNEETSKYFVIG